MITEFVITQFHAQHINSKEVGTRNKNYGPYGGKRY